MHLHLPLRVQWFCIQPFAWDLLAHTTACNEFAPIPLLVTSLHPPWSIHPIALCICIHTMKHAVIFCSHPIACGGIAPSVELCIHPIPSSTCSKLCFHPVACDSTALAMMHTTGLHPPYPSQCLCILSFAMHSPLLHPTEHPSSSPGAEQPLHGDHRLRAAAMPTWRGTHWGECCLWVTPPPCAMQPAPPHPSFPPCRRAAQHRAAAPVPLALPLQGTHRVPACTGERGVPCMGEVGGFAWGTPVLSSPYPTGFTALMAIGSPRVGVCPAPLHPTAPWDVQVSVGRHGQLWALEHGVMDLGWNRFSAHGTSGTTPPNPAQEDSVPK